MRDYYRSICSVDIGEVARELLAPHGIGHDDQYEIHANCPVHSEPSSSSRSALKVELGKQVWKCHGKCDVGGGVLQLVEFCRSGKVTLPGTRGAMPASHRDARDWLAARIGLPSLQKIAMSPEDMEVYERNHAEERRVRQALAALTTIYRDALRATPAAKSWLAERYPISDHTYDSLMVGFVPPENTWVDGNGRTHVPAQWQLTGAAGDGTISEDLRALGAPFTRDELLATGAFIPAEGSESMFSRFAGRIIFPYWSGGSVVYAIARSTQFTPQIMRDGALVDAPKYEKLATRNEKHLYVSACIKNTFLWNEDALLRCPQAITMPEGMTDAMAIHEIGLPVVSPVTTKVAAHDWPRFIGKLKAHGVETVYLANDLEFNGEGQRGALRSAAHLEAAGIEARLIELPQSDAQAEAIATLAGLGLKAGDRNVAKAIGALAPESRAQALAAMPKAKQDVASFLLMVPECDRRATWEALQREAKSPLEIAISALPCSLDLARSSGALDDLLESVARLGSVDAEIACKKIQAKLGGQGKGGVSIALVRDMVGEARRKLADQPSRDEPPPTSCREAVDRIINFAKPGDTLAYQRAGDAVFDWLTAHGGSWCKTIEGDLFLFYEERLFFLVAPGGSRAPSDWHSFIMKITGVEPTVMAGGRLLASTIRLRALDVAQHRDVFAWNRMDVGSHEAWIALGNAKQEIAALSPSGVKVVANGANEKGVVLRIKSSFVGWDYADDVSGAEFDELLDARLVRHLTCAPEDRQIVKLWLCALWLREFSGTRPHLRFEGPQSSGKSSAATLCSHLILGYEELRTPQTTTAANYSAAAIQPIIILDNMETANAKQDVVDLLLTGATGGLKSKRALGTDSGTLEEKVHAGTLTTGVESIGAHLPELQSRSFVIDFDRAKFSSSGFSLPYAVAAMQKDRARILSGLLARASRVLAMIAAGARDKAQTLLESTLGPHPKDRTNDWLAIMYLFLIVDLPEEERAAHLLTLMPEFERAIRGMNETTDTIARDANPIANAMATLFDRWRVAYSVSASDADLSERFGDRYPGIVFAHTRGTKRVTAGALFGALSSICKDQGLRFPYSNAQQFARRLRNDIKTVEAAGFAVEIGMNGKQSYYIVKQLDPEDERDLATGGVGGWPSDQSSMWPSREAESSEPDPDNFPL